MTPDAYRALSAQVEAHIKGCHHNDVEGAVCVGCSLLQEQQAEIERLRRTLQSIADEDPSKGDDIVFWAESALKADR